MLKICTLPIHVCVEIYVWDNIYLSPLLETKQIFYKFTYIFLHGDLEISPELFAVGSYGTDYSNNTGSQALPRELGGYYGVISHDLIDHKHLPADGYSQSVVDFTLPTKYCLLYT